MKNWTWTFLLFRKTKETVDIPTAVYSYPIIRERLIRVISNFFVPFFFFFRKANKLYKLVLYLVEKDFIKRWEMRREPRGIASLRCDPSGQMSLTLPDYIFPPGYFLLLLFM